MRRTPALGLGLAFMLTATLTACSEDNGSADVASVSTEADRNTTTTTGSSVPAGPGTSTSVPATSPKRYLTDMKALRVDGKDVVQFTFDNMTPGYAAEYITPPITDEGEGKTVAISGDNVLKLALESSGTVELSATTKTYYNGPARITPTDTNTVSEVVKVSEFEGRLLFGIGTRSKTPFTVTSQGNMLTVTFG